MGKNDCDEEEDELEALRMAALASIKPKKPAYKVQAHPVRNNLLSIVPVEDQGKPKPKLAVIVPRNSTAKESSPAGKNSSKFNRYDSDKSSIESDSEEEIEVEEEVTATESEGEEPETNDKDGKQDVTRAKTE